MRLQFGGLRGTTLARLSPLALLLLCFGCATSSQSFSNGLNFSEFLTGGNSGIDYTPDNEAEAASEDIQLAWVPSETDIPILPSLDDEEQDFLDSADEDTEPAPIATEEGVVSFYGKGFVGKKIASGEKFDPETMTAAHKTLPFGTIVRVVRLDTLQNVIVRINNRGPYIKGRIIDLAAQPARLIGLMDKGKGIAPCRLEILQYP